MAWPLLIEFALCPVVLVSLLWVTAPYGRHYRRGWGPVLPNRVAWTVMEWPALLVIVGFTLASPWGRAPAAWVPLTLWCSHYTYRTFIFPALMRPSDKTFPLALVLFAIAFNVLNGYNNAMALQDSAAAGRTLPSLHFAVGALIFVAGFVLHLWADAIIRALRRPGERGYAVPHGGPFRWCGNPNYLGEIVMWSGWAVLTWSLAGLAFALFTFCNLAPRALANDRWYRSTFPGYPAARKALIPGLL